MRARKPPSVWGITASHHNPGFLSLKLKKSTTFPLCGQLGGEQTFAHLLNFKQFVRAESFDKLSSLG